MSDPVMIQANSTGYSGKSCTVLSVFNPETGVLIIKKLVSLQKERVKGCLVVAFDSAHDCDAVMTPDDFSDAVQAFLMASTTDRGAGKLLTFDQGTERASPASVIEVGEYQESGARVRVDAGLTCEQMGVVATCWMARNQIAVEDCFDFFDQLGAFQRGMGFSI